MRRFPQIFIFSFFVSFFGWKSQSGGFSSEYRAAHRLMHFHFLSSGRFTLHFTPKNARNHTSIVTEPSHWLSNWSRCCQRKKRKKFCYIIRFGRHTQSKMSSLLHPKNDSHTFPERWFQWLANIPLRSRTHHPQRHRLKSLRNEFYLLDFVFFPFLFFIVLSVFSLARTPNLGGKLSLCTPKENRNSRGSDEISHSFRKVEQLSVLSELLSVAPLMPRRRFMS